MKQGKLVLADAPLKQLLRLFDAGATVTIRALGDVMHPASGYVDAAIVNGIDRVSQLLRHPYNFEGLIYFEAVIQNAVITYKAEQYEIEGDVKTLAKIKNSIREINALYDRPLFIILPTY
jgi:hypothetical protein